MSKKRIPDLAFWDIVSACHLGEAEGQRLVHQAPGSMNPKPAVYFRMLQSHDGLRPPKFNPGIMAFNRLMRHGLLERANGPSSIGQTEYAPTQALLDLMATPKWEAIRQIMNEARAAA